MTHERKLIIVDEAVPQELMLDLVEFITERGFRFGWHSNKKKLYTHWNQVWKNSKKAREDVEGHLPEPAKAVWDHLAQTHMRGMVLIGGYANAYQLGSEGYVHRDSKDPNDRTVVVYCNPEWSPDWGGETVFIDARGDTVRAVSPRWARAIMFPSNWMHAARPVTRECHVLRVVAVFKCRVPTAEELEQHDGSQKLNQNA